LYFSKKQKLLKSKTKIT